MNAVITDMYRKNASSASVESGSVEETTACPVMSTSNGMNYCIDRTGVQSVDSMSVSDQQHPSSSGPLTVDDVKATATTRAGSTADEDSHQHNIDLNPSVKVLEHSSTVAVSKHCSVEQKHTVTDLHLSLQSKVARASGFSITSLFNSYFSVESLLASFCPSFLSPLVMEDKTEKEGSVSALVIPKGLGTGLTSSP